MSVPQPAPWVASYAPGVPAHVDFEDTTVPEALLRAVQRWPQRAALIFRGRPVSYARLGQEVAALAGWLVAQGAGPGTRVAIHLPNLPQTVVAFQAVLATGAAAVLTNPLYTDAELVHQWNDAEAHFAIVGDWLWAARFEALAPKLPVRTWLTTAVIDALPWYQRPFAARKLAARTPPMHAPLPARPGVHRWRQALRAAPLPRPVPRLPDLALIQYTGGTTGKSKGAMLTHANLSRNVQQLIAWMPDLKPGGEVYLAAPPFFHVYGLTACLNQPLWTGASIVVVPDPRDSAGLLSEIAARRVSILSLVPAMFHAITQRPEAAGTDFSSLRHCFSGSAPLPGAVQERFEQLARVPVSEGYGLTETSPVTHCNPLGRPGRRGTIGLPVPDTQVAIVDVEDPARVLAVGEEGELAVAGPQVMAGYWKRPEESAAALRDGWFLTGDIAAMDPDGFFRIVGRKKEMIITGGLKVYPDEVDAVLMQHPDVLEAATIGVPHPTASEIVKSFVVPRPGRSPNEQELREFCRAHLASYKIPREITLRDALPRSSVLKLLRRELLAEELAARTAAERARGRP